MKRSGFKKPEWPFPASSREQRIDERAERLGVMMNGVRAAPPLRKGVIARAATAATARPKSVPQRNPRLLAMAKGQACLLRISGVCNGDKETTVACHSNLSEHGKAGRRKADDQYSVWGCSACHHWLDQGGSDARLKALMFWCAMGLMKDIWEQIDAGLLESTPAERKAVRWALERV